VSPEQADVLTCGTQQIIATVTGTDDTGVTWTLDGDATRGTIDIEGMYTAPIKRPDPNEVTITATAHADPTKSASSKLTLWTALPEAPSMPGADYDSTISHHQIAGSGATSTPCRCSATTRRRRRPTRFPWSRAMTAARRSARR
jgi:hypothetical protein